MKKYIGRWFLLPFLSTIELAYGQKGTTNEWQALSSYFSVPEIYKDYYGSFRPLLRFDNGDSVRNAADWSRRRQEIKNRWTRLMGAWPAIITNQDLKVIRTEQVQNFSQHTVRFRWTPTEETEGYLLVPQTPGRKPAVIVTFYEPETAIGRGGKPHRDFARQLARRGFVALSIGTREPSAEKTYSLFYPDIHNNRVQPLSMLAYAAANAYEALARLPDVDPCKVGIVGHSFGGKWAMFASCLYEKFACAAWSDPGIVFDESRAAVNYWEPYYLGYHPPPWRKRGDITRDNPARGLYLQLRKEGHDLHELHALMAPRPFLVSGGSEDPPNRWIALNHSVAVNRLLGYTNRVAMTNRSKHDPNPESNQIMYSFFEYFLKNNTPRK